MTHAKQMPKGLPHRAPQLSFLRPWSVHLFQCFWVLGTRHLFCSLVSKLEVLRAPRAVPDPRHTEVQLTVSQNGLRTGISQEIWLPNGFVPKWEIWTPPPQKKMVNIKIGGKWMFIHLKMARHRLQFPSRKPNSDGFASGKHHGVHHVQEPVGGRHVGADALAGKRQMGLAQWVCRFFVFL